MIGNKLETESIISEDDFITVPFLTSPREKKLNYSLVLDLDETLIYFPDELMD